MDTNWIKKYCTTILGVLFGTMAGLGLALGFGLYESLIKLFRSIIGVYIHDFRGLLEKLQDNFILIIIILLSLLLLSFVVIPMIIWLCGVFKIVFFKKQPNFAIQDKYRQILSDCIQYIIVASAFIIAFYIAIIASHDFLTIHPSSGNTGNIGKLGNVEKQMVHILSHSGNILKFVTLLIAAITMLGGLFILWVTRRSSEAVVASKTANEIANTAKQQMDSLKTANYNFILSADMALMNLPSFTYTQQIPLSALKSLQILDNVFEEKDKKGDLWRTISGSDNGVRILYARALYLLGIGKPSLIGSYKSSGSPTDGMSGHSETILGLLYEANLKAEVTGTTSFHRDILERIFQALRQKEDYKTAEDILKVLRVILANGSANDRVLSDWGLCVLYLQQAEATPNLQKRQTLFLQAANSADNVFDQIAEKINGNYEFKPPFNSINGNASIFYYLTKAYWSLRFSLPKKQHLETADIPEGISVDLERITEWQRRFFFLFYGKADEILKNEYERVKREDEFMAAIYSSTRAYLFIAAREWLDSPDPMGTISDLIMKAGNHLKEGYQQARNSLRNNAHIQIYCDLRERLETVDNFGSYLQKLDEWATTKGSIYDYYHR